MAHEAAGTTRNETSQITNFILQISYSQAAFVLILLPKVFFGQMYRISNINIEHPLNLVKISTVVHPIILITI